VAVPSDVANSTDVARPDTADCVTVNTMFVMPPFPSKTDASSMLIAGIGSSLTIVPVASPSPIVALVALPILTTSV